MGRKKQFPDAGIRDPWALPGDGVSEAEWVCRAHLLFPGSEPCLLNVALWMGGGPNHVLMLLQVKPMGRSQVLL